MKILLATSEVAPLAKTGGLADVCGALPRELERLGHQVTVFLPAYREVFSKSLKIEPANIQFEVPVGTKNVSCRLLTTKLPGTKVVVYLVDQPEYFDREGIYGEGGKDYSDNCARFVFFCRAVLE